MKPTPSEKISVRVGFETRPSQIEAIDRWRAHQHPIPSRNEAIRKLIDSGLAVMKARGSNAPEKYLVLRIDRLPLSARAWNCLKNDNMVYLGDLVRRSEAYLLRTPNFGRKSLIEIHELLSVLGLSLGMDLPDWPPANIEELSADVEPPSSLAGLWERLVGGRNRAIYNEVAAAIGAGSGQLNAIRALAPRYGITAEGVRQIYKRVSEQRRWMTEGRGVAFWGSW